MFQANKFLAVSFFLLFVSVAGNGQIRMSYQIGCIGGTGDTLKKTSGIVALGYQGCFRVSNGIQKFAVVKRDLFTVACVEKAPAELLQMKAYPNPVVKDLYVKSLIAFPESSGATYHFVISDFNGNVMRQQQTDIGSINSGYKISMQDLPRGYYTITVYTEKKLVKSFKIIKS